MKKLLILFVVIFVLFGCEKKENNPQKKIIYAPIKEMKLEDTTTKIQLDILTKRLSVFYILKYYFKAEADYGEYEKINLENLSFVRRNELYLKDKTSELKKRYVSQLNKIVKEYNNTEKNYDGIDGAVDFRERGELLIEMEIICHIIDNLDLPDKFQWSEE